MKCQITSTRWLRVPAENPMKPRSRGQGVGNLDGFWGMVGIGFFGAKKTALPGSKAVLAMLCKMTNGFYLFSPSFLPLPLPLRLLSRMVRISSAFLDCDSFKSFLRFRISFPIEKLLLSFQINRRERCFPLWRHNSIHYKVLRLQFVKAVVQPFEEHSALFRVFHAANGAD